MSDLRPKENYDAGAGRKTRVESEMVTGFLNASLDATLIETLEGRVLDCNLFACQMFGYTRAEFLNLNGSDLLPPESAAALSEKIGPAQLDSGTRLKAFNRRKDGQVFPVEVSTRPITLEGEDRLVVFVRDITERERFSEALARHAEEISTPYQTSIEINSQPDLPTLLHAIIERAGRLAGVTMGAIYMVRPDKESLELVVDYKLPGDYTGTVLHFGEGLAGRVALSGDTLIIANYYEWEGNAKAFSDQPFRRMLGVPLKVENQVIGVIVLTDCVRTDPFGEQDIQSVVLMASQAAIAIRNSKLYAASGSELVERKRAEKVQSALYRISDSALVSQDLEALYRSIHVIIGELMLAPNFYIALYNETADMISFPYFADEYDLAPSLRTPGKGMTEYVLRTGQPMMVTPEVFARLVDRGDVEDVGSPSLDWIGVPLKAQKKTFGVMAVQTYSEQVRYSQADLDILIFVSTQVAMAIERKQAEEALRHSEEQYRQLFENAPVGIVICNPQGKILDVNPATLVILGSPSAEATKTINMLTFPPLVEAGVSADLCVCLQEGRALVTERPYTSKWGKTSDVRYHLTPVFGPEGQVSQLQMLIEDITERKKQEAEVRQLNQSLQRRAEQLALLVDAGLALNGTLDTHEQLKTLAQIAMQAVQADNSAFFRYYPAREEIHYEIGVGRGAGLESKRILNVHLGEERGLVGWLALKRMPFYLPDVSADPRWIVTDPELHSAFWMPVEHENRLLGMITVASTHYDAFSPDDRRLIVLFANQVAVALEKQWLFDAERQQREFAETLSKVGMVLASSLDVQAVLDLLLEEVSRVIPNDASDIILIEGDQVRVTNWRGYDRFNSEAHIHNLVVPLNDLQTLSQMISSGQPLVVSDTYADPLWVRIPGLEWQSSFAGAPIRVRDSVIGFLGMTSATPGLYGLAHAEQLRAFAAQAAAALENARLYQSAIAAYKAAIDAYEATIEGWSRALEMRDKDTQGHSERVIRFTLSLARELGYPEEEILHLRRGVLLHDIGKMVVPDQILLKPGPLNDDEWVIMRQHPSYAYNMLSGIEFLDQSVDIPYCHHEKWDGSGYPRQLKGDEIPYGARIFSVIDVWDALTSNRPYRPAWIPEVARAYIVSQTGTRFDPRVVSIFLKLLDAGEIR